jgi:hypothetical protein
MDPSKFFNRKINIRNPKTPYQQGKFVDESQNYSNRISSRINQSPLTKSLFSLRNKVFQIENLLNGIFSLDKKRQEQGKKIKAAEVPDKKPKTKGPQIFGKLIQKPKTGALGLIKDFVTFTFLGWLFTKLQPLLGGLTKLAPLLEGMAWFIGGTIKNMVDVFATFLKLGFDAKEKFDNIVADIKKNTKGIDKTFDATLNPLKAVFDGVIQLANSFLITSVKADELNEAKTQLFKEQTVDTVPAMPPLPKVDEPQMPQTSDPFPTPQTNPGVVQKFNTGGVIRGYNEGGRIDPRTPVTRGVERQRREVPKPKPIIQPQKTAPGKDVGGDKKIKQLYDQTAASSIADFIPLPSFFRSDKKSGFAALMGASEEYKKPMTNDILGIGNMMGASVDSALGQKIEKKSYTQFADGIKYLVNYGRTEPEEFAKLDLEDMVRKIVEPRVNMAINRIQEEINKKGKVEVDSGDGGGGGLDFGGDVGDYADLIALIVAEESAGHGGYEAFNTGGYGSAPSGSANSINTPVGGILKPLTQRTVKDIMNMHNRRQIHATGRYQIIATTLRGLISGAYGQTGVSENDLYDAATQDKLAIALIKNRLKDPTLQNFRDEWTGLEKVPDNVLKAAIEKAKIGRLYNVSDILSSNLKGLVLHSGPGGLIQGGSGSRGEADYAVHFHLDTKNPNPTKEELANVREVAFKAVKIMLARGSKVYFGNVKEYASNDDNTLKRQIAEDQRRHAQRSTPGVDIQEINSNVGPTIKGLPGSRIAFPFAVGHVYRKGGYGREAEIIGSGGVVVSHGAAGSAASIVQRPQQTRSQQLQAPRQAPRTSSSGPLTPLASSDRRGFLINNQMYYVDLKTGFITNSQGKTINDEAIGKVILQRLTPGDRQKLEKLKNQKGSQNIPWWGRMLPGISSIKPNLPADKYASYEQPDSQERLIAIQPVIMNNPIPVPVSSGPVAYALPRISNLNTPIPIS